MIPIFDITRQNKLLKKGLDKAIWDVINKGNFILGEKVVEFEREFAKYIGVKYAVGVASGTDALSLALLAVGVDRGDEVILPANAYPTAFAVTAIGAIPKLVDIDPATYNIDPKKIPAAISKKTKAIIPVHLYGQPVDLVSLFRNIRTIGRKIYVIEDCAQAVGAAVRHLGGDKMSLRSSGSTDGGGIWRKIGPIGDAGCFSFYPTKNLGCFGDGGMVVTNNEEIYEEVRLLRMYGEKTRYKSVLLGRNSRLDELQAAILLVKLKYLDLWNTKRRKLAELYFSQLPITNCQLPIESSCAKHVYHLFVIRAEKRDHLKDYLGEKGIQTAIHYPVPIHLVPSMKFLGGKIGDFPESEKACEEILSLPMFPELKDEEVKQVTKAVNYYCS